MHHADLAGDEPDHAAVGGRGGNRFVAHDRPGAVHHLDGPAQVLRHVLRDEARALVAAAAGHVRHDELDRHCFAAISESVFFETLPNVDTGKSSTTSRRSGSLNLAISLPLRKSTSSGSSTFLPGLRTRQAHIFSPRFGSGTGTQATFCTAGCIRIRFSTSSQLIFSPPRLMRSFLRPSTM